MSFGSIIKEIRIRKGLSQYDVSYGVCSQSTISDFEAGKKIIGIDTYMKILNKLGIPISMNCNPLLDDPFSLLKDYYYRGNFEGASFIINEIEAKNNGMLKDDYFNYRMNFHIAIRSFVNKEFDNAKIYNDYSILFLKNSSLDLQLESALLTIFVERKKNSGQIKHANRLAIDILKCTEYSRNYFILTLCSIVFFISNEYNLLQENSDNTISKLREIFSTKYLDILHGIMAISYFERKENAKGDFHKGLCDLYATQNQSIFNFDFIAYTFPASR